MSAEAVAGLCGEVWGCRCVSALARTLARVAVFGGKKAWPVVCLHEPEGLGTLAAESTPSPHTLAARVPSADPCIPDPRDPQPVWCVGLWDSVDSGVGRLEP